MRRLHSLTVGASLSLGLLQAQSAPPAQTQPARLTPAEQMTIDAQLARRRECSFDDPQPIDNDDPGR